MRKEIDPTDARVARIAARQHGVVTTEQLRAEGFVGSGVTRRVQAGRLHRVHRGVYAVGHRGLSNEGRWMAAVLACGEGAVLSHRSAAALWELLRPMTGPVDVSIPSGSGRAARKGIALHRCASLGRLALHGAPLLVTEHKGIPVTSPARTIADLRGVVPPYLVRRATRQAEFAKLIDPSGSDRTRSDLEGDFLGLCRRSGIPAPEVNVRVGPLTVDFLWRRQQVAVETDSYRYHRGQVAFQDDRARDLELRRHGLAVRRYSELQVNESPAAVMADLRGALEAASQTSRRSRVSLVAVKSARFPILFSVCLQWLGIGAVPASADEAASIYDPATVNVIEMTLPEPEIQKLEADPFTYVKGGTLTFTPTDGTPPPGGKGTPTHTFQNVEVKLKGKPQGSFEDLGGKAAFKLKFKKAEPFFGLRKLTLNNMTQDRSMIHETLAYTAFRAAGVPASRSGYSYVWLNGENYGLHLNLESLDTVSLPRIFGSPFDDEMQHLYEANEYGADFYPGKEPRFEVDEGADDIADLTALIAAVDAAAPSGTISPGLAALVDLEEMTGMWGVEKYIGHWDGYAGEGIPGQEGFNEHRPNNYYLYSEPSGRFQMLPWGADQTWDVVETGGVPMEFDRQDGRLFDLCREDEDCAGLFSGAVANALGTIEPLELDALAAETAAMLEPWQALEAAPRKPFSSTQIATAVSKTCEFILNRPAEAEEWLEEHPPPGGFTPPSEGTRGPPCAPRVVLPPPFPPPPSPPSDTGTTPQRGGGGAQTGEGGQPGGQVKLPIGESFMSIRRIKLAGGAIRTRLNLATGGTVRLSAKVHRRGGADVVCGDRAGASGPGVLTLRCQLPDPLLRSLSRHSRSFTLIVRFAGPDGNSEVIRQVSLPRG